MDRPIIFSAPMVRALLAGRKTQTRRLLKPQPFIDKMGNFCTPRKGKSHLIWGQHMDGRPCTRNFAAERFRVGDRLWVRESIRLPPSISERMLRDGADTWPRAYYDAEMDEVDRDWCREHDWKSRPSIHMPRWASRLTLTVTDVRVQRLQEISEEDAATEGAPDYVAFLRAHERPRDGDETPEEVTSRLKWKQRWFEALWRDLHGPDAWADNPWIIALTFTVERRNIDA